MQRTCVRIQGFMSIPFFLALVAFLRHQVAVRLSSAISLVDQYAARLFVGVFFRAINASHVSSITRIPADEMSFADRCSGPNLFISLYPLQIIRPKPSVFSLATLIVYYTTRDEKSWPVQSTCKLQPEPKARGKHVLWRVPLYSHVAYTIFHYTRTKNTTFAIRSRELKSYFRPGYGENLVCLETSWLYRGPDWICTEKRCTDGHLRQSPLEPSSNLFYEQLPRMLA